MIKYSLAGNYDGIGILLSARLRYSGNRSIYIEIDECVVLKLRLMGYSIDNSHLTFHPKALKMVRVIAVFLILAMAGGLSAQPDRNQKFAAAGYVGANFSQIHGDNFFGYNNTGLRFGIETQYLLQPKYFISVGIGFSQEGARPNLQEVDKEGGNATVLKLAMVEIPLLFNYRLGDERATKRKDNHALYRSTTLQAGMKLTRLISSRTLNRGFFDQLIQSPAYTEAEIEFQDFDFAAVAGVTIQLGLKTAIFLQHSLSLKGLYAKSDLERIKGSPYMVSQLRPYSLTVGGKIILY
ncbi:outer membrane beta-barrel protein [Neolewinella agarilytica]|uniref:Outer membrane protein beta-barrel domain-containing protein n=1 Tax=Neolewinella agarilytica TaxID=478744 RepID=A0A1H9HWA9_9BACT|nr:outer membrane beta-barrel protein [Neolewinella agarilytica]SEQ66542.1 hypothetical protein SAMN05444359_113131 [Neolewinella agarilytica]